MPTIVTVIHHCFKDSSYFNEEMGWNNTEKETILRFVSDDRIVSLRNTEHKLKEIYYNYWVLYMRSRFRRVQLFATPWTVARQAPLSMEFSRQEYWNGLPFSSPGHILDPGIETGLLNCRQILNHLSYQGSPSKVVAWAIWGIFMQFSWVSPMLINYLFSSCLSFSIGSLNKELKGYRENYFLSPTLPKSLSGSGL